MKLSITSSGAPNCRKVYPAINHPGIGSRLVAGHFKAGMAGRKAVVNM
jgi:hypothetical protein